MKSQKDQEEKEKEARKKKEKADKEAGIEMREKAMQGLSSEYHKIVSSIFNFLCYYFLRNQETSFQ